METNNIPMHDSMSGSLGCSANSMLGTSMTDELPEGESEGETQDGVGLARGFLEMLIDQSGIKVNDAEVLVTSLDGNSIVELRCASINVGSLADPNGVGSGGGSSDGGSSGSSASDGCGRDEPTHEPTADEPTVDEPTSNVPTADGARTQDIGRRCPDLHPSRSSAGIARGSNSDDNGGGGGDARNVGGW
jgi:hypothetical protein